MTSPTLSPLDPHADEQAALWAARLDGGELSSADRSALARWLEETPAHRALLSQYCQLSTDLEQQLPPLARQGAFAEDLPSVARPAAVAALPPFYRRARLWATAAVFTAAAAGIVLMVTLSRPETQFERVAAAIGQRQKLTLADGTLVELNAQTALVVALTPDERHIRLAGGEAFFSVSKDLGRPFIVETPAGSVRVTGTKFNVRAEPASALDVLVVEGSVQVRPGIALAPGAPLAPAAIAPVDLRPGHHLLATARGVDVQTLTPGAVGDRLAWREGQVVFDGTPLAEALARFARYHGRGLTALGAAAELRVGGRFSLEDLDGFLAGLEEAMPVEVSRELSGGTVVRLRTKP